MICPGASHADMLEFNVFQGGLFHYTSYFPFMAVSQCLTTESFLSEKSVEEMNYSLSTKYLIKIKDKRDGIM